MGLFIHLFVNFYQIEEQEWAAWEQIDAEQDLAILKSLALLSLVNEQSQSFWRWRIYMLEHKDLWPYLAAKE